MKNIDHLYIFIFALHYDRDRGLDQGLLKLFHNELGCLNVWKATSSTARKQFKESFHQRGGIIPPEQRVPGIKKWEVLNKPLDRRNVKGIESYMFQILPFSVITDMGGRRSDLAIHLDGNVPGSMGCIVMNKFNWDCFEKTMAELRARNVLRIPLSVTLT